MSKNNRDETLLNQLTSSIVYYLKKVGIYQYNKLTYLFEYFYIKNFGERFTKEKFVKINHGPVIANYKSQITNLAKMGYISVDLDELKKKREVDSDKKIKIEIFANKLTGSNLLSDTIARNLLREVLKKFGNYSIDELESYVYQTKPVEKFMSNVQKGFNRRGTGYVLQSPNLSIREGKKNISPGIKMALDHIKKYPEPDKKQMREDYEEFRYLENYRPQYE